MRPAGSVAQVLLHKLAIMLRENARESVTIAVSAPSHSNIGDPSDGWCIHLMNGQEQIHFGIGGTLEAAIAETMRLLHFDTLCKEMTVRDAYLRSHDRLRDDLEYLGLQGEDLS